MKILIDTHILLWAAVGELSSQAAVYIEDRTNTLFFSSASIWEVVIKRNLRRKDFIIDPVSFYHGLLDADYEELSINGQHTLYVSNLPMLHKDPFDRLLLAQSAAERMPLLTADEQLSKYPGSIIYAGK